MQIWNDLKNASLVGGFNASGATYYLSIPLPPGAPQSETLPNQVVSFDITSNGTISLESAVQFVVQEGTVLNRVYVSTQPITGTQAGTAVTDTITLEGEEVKNFAELGIYMISTINISLMEGV